MSTNCPRLTTNGCLYLNLGFKQTYIMQVLTYSLSQNQQIHLILYDGHAYIGAIYSHLSSLSITQANNFQHDIHFNDESKSDSTNILKLHVYDIVKVYPQLVIQNQPIILKSLQVIKSSIDGPLGNQIITLNQFMHKRSFYRPPVKEIQIESDQQSRKMIKIDKIVLEQQSIISLQKSIEIQQQNIPRQNTQNIQENQANQKNQIVINISQYNAQNHAQNENDIIDKEKQIVQIPIQPIQQQLNVNTNKSSQTDITHLPINKNDILNTNMEIQDNITYKKIHQDQNISNRQEQTTKITKKVGFQQKSLNKSIIIQQVQTQKNQYANYKKSKKEQSHQLYQIQDDSDVVIIDKSYQISQVSQPSSTLRKSQIKQEGPTMFIKDLYQRMHRFYIHCRINFITQFVSQKGLPCTKIFLIDQKGDQIVCMIYDKATQNQTNNNVSLVKGKVYSFQNGQVVQQDGNLSISINRNGIIEQKSFFQSFNPKKMLKVGQIYANLTLLKENSQSIQNSKYSKQVSICGILFGFVQEPKLLKFQFKVIGLLCDPQSQKSVTFTLFVDELTSFPQKGSVVSLHNMKIFQDGHIIRLQPSRRSYILNQKGNTHEFFSQLTKSSDKAKYKLLQYRNLSQISFISRNISQLKHILSRILEHDFAYSQIDCSIIKITQKRMFNACVVCKKQTKQQPGHYTYCFTCKKVNKYNKRVVFDMQVSDSTGSIELVLLTSKLQGFINMSEEQYIKNSRQDRQCFLQLCTYKNIILKVKSQRVIGGSNHMAISAQKPSSKRGLNQIVQKIVQDKTKYISNW